ncbi:MAG: acetoin dehydrogenase dihydrolipoyllysine-residue acetyltransferase subunit [Alphaproteobacteria bacterium]|nr:MAG: acetoin dehydrogenase dihydrolipoyllysine-residue acetyltransferase subunit [Alphaproteobacteria bacterium]
MSSEIIPIKVPKWGLAMEEGTIITWHVAEGDHIAKGDEIVDIESSKIANVLEAPASGPLRRIVAAEGEVLPVGALLGVVADESVDDDTIDAFIADYQERFAKEAAEAGSAGPSPETVDAGSLTLEYLKLAPADFEGGVPAVLIHGFGGDKNNWLFNQAPLAEHRATYALDLPGHGGSTKKVDRPDLDGLTDAVIAFLDALELEQVNLIGHSMGGAVALNLALKAPDRVNAVVTVNGAGYGTAVNPDYITNFLGAKKRRDMKAAAELLFADSALVTRDMLEDMIRFKRLDGVEEALKAIAEATLLGENLPDLRARLGDIKAPILGLWGAKDQVITVPDTAALPENIKAHLFDDAGHMAHMEAANEANEIIEAFLEEQD